MALRAERIEWELGGHYLQTGDSTGSILCRDGEDFHVFRIAAEPAPRWRMYWRDAANSLHRSDWTSAPAEATTHAATLTPVWTQDGFAFPVRIPLYLLTMFGKGEKDNLSKAERNELAELVGLLKDLAGG